MVVPVMASRFHGIRVKTASDQLKKASRVTVLTGAGISAESGVPTFRGDEGLWRDYRAEDLATAQAFFKDPTLVWSWYLWRRELIAACRPNPAHYALAGLEAQKPGMRLITQNVDGLHRLAGSRNLLEIHGCIWQVRCTACGESYEERELNLPLPPPCRACGGLIRPAVVWFGENLDQNLLQRSWQAAADAEVMLVIGTSALVQPAAGLALVAKKAGAYVIEINLEPTPNSDWVDESLLGKAGEVLPRLVQGGGA
jgi:NAD-dependent deacetylase